MFINYKDKVITSILSIIPKNKIFFEKNINNYNFSKNQSLKLKKIMGFNTRHVASKKTTVSDLSVYGINYLLKKNIKKKILLR